MSAYDLLSEPIKKYIWDKGWMKFTPIQEASIQKILSTEDNYILAAKTASGKTEAAFLPILSLYDLKKIGVQVLYISPLIALINDQFMRMDELCKYLDVKVTKWHGEANISQKNELLRNPKGIMLITPESLEAMFVNKPQNIKLLFHNLNFVVIDEIHSFIGSKRGIQLQSLLYRLSKINLDKTRYIALSATLGDYSIAKEFFGDSERTKVLLDKGKNLIQVEFKYFKSEDTSLPTELLNDLYEVTQNHKVLIFPNTRGRVEEVAVKLKRISKKKDGHEYYFAHHSSVDRDLREFIEEFAKTNKRYNFSISCTSTLELGIDIGSVDIVVQIDSTFSISSLIQRLGRSGRTTGQSNLILYATNPWSLLQSIACYELYKEDFIEPNGRLIKNYDLAIHQILSIVKEKSGIDRLKLIEIILQDYPLRDLEKEELEEIITSLIQEEILEEVDRDIIIGLKGDHIVNNKDFYSVFETQDNFKVFAGNRSIGELPLSPQLIPGENILLAANIWKILEVDEKTKKVFVVKALDGKKPVFFGSGGEIHAKVRLKMLEIIVNKLNFDYLDEKGLNALNELIQSFKYHDIKSLQLGRPLIERSTENELFTFTGTRINRTLDALIRFNGTKDYHYVESSSSFIFNKNIKDYKSYFNDLINSLSKFEELLYQDIITKPEVYNLGKWGGYLDSKFKTKLLMNNFFNIVETTEFLKKLDIIFSKV